ncbi:MAG: Crp/Fnr family transcriptional regulator [Bacteroidota bacterium]
MSNPLLKLFEYFEAHGLFGRTLELKRGEHLLLPGDNDPNVYFVASGTIRYYVIVNDEEQIIRFGYEGDFTSALDTFVSNRPTLFHAQALRKCTLRQIKRSDLQEKMREDPELSRYWQKVMAWMVIGQLEREIDLLTNDPAERYQRVFTRSPRLFQEIPAKYIANYLRMTPETLSRVKK